MAQLTDAQLTTEAEIIRDETTIAANTATRIGEMFVNSIDSKINIDAISTDTSLGISDSLVPSQNAVKQYVDNYSSTIGLQNVLDASYNTISGLTFTTGTNDSIAVIDSLLLNSDQLYQLPNKSGTIALLSDISNSNSWETTGNTGTTSGTDFIGTTDNVDLVFKTNNTEQLILKSTGGSGNIETPYSIWATNDMGGADITAKDSTGLNGFASIAFDTVDKGVLILGNGSVRGTIKVSNLSSTNKTYQLPNASGTIALTSDINNRPYKVYTAIISQTGTSAPTVDRVLENTLGFTPTYTYLSPGSYQVHSSSAWSASKTIVFTSIGYLSDGYIIGCYLVSASDISIISKNSNNGVNQNDLIYQCSIEIRIYN